MKRLQNRKDKQPRRKLANGNGSHRKATATATSWNPDLDAYEDLKALTFSTADHIDAAIDLLWSGALRNMPHELAGGDTIIVPAEAVEHFKAGNLTFSEDDVLAPGELAGDELSALRREQGPY